MRGVLLALSLVVVVVLVLVRFMPADIERFHISAGAQTYGDYPSEGGHMVVRGISTTPDRILEVLNDVALATPRTTLLAGSVADNMLTYVTRSAVIGFPDYTTVEILADPETDDPLLVMNARLRFGRSDFGVNQARVQRWLDELGLLTVLQ